MSKTSLLKTLAISLFVLDSLIILFLVFSLIMALINKIIITKVYFIILVVFIILNLFVTIYSSIILLKNRDRKV